MQMSGMPYARPSETVYNLFSIEGSRAKISECWNFGQALRFGVRALRQTEEVLTGSYAQLQQNRQGRARG